MLLGPAHALPLGRLRVSVRACGAGGVIVGVVIGFVLFVCLLLVLPWMELYWDWCEAVCERWRKRRR